MVYKYMMYDNCRLTSNAKAHISFPQIYFDEKKYMDDAGGIGILFLNHNIKRIINSQNTDVFGVYMKEGEH